VQTGIQYRRVVTFYLDSRFRGRDDFYEFINFRAIKKSKMYTKFYGLKEKPFEITPNPNFLYLGENHKEALATLLYAVRGKKGFTVITGEVGTGKTTLIHSLLSILDGKTRTAYIFNPKLGTTDFLHYICEDFGVKVNKGSKGQYLAQLHNFLMNCYSNHENVLLIVDEAQKLSPDLLEEIRLLTNLETPQSKLLQVILMGQPELDDILSQPKFRQLKQRVSLRYQIQAFNKEETVKYIERRLIKAGAFDPHFFTPKALKEIYKYSKGIPRLINVICDNALLNGYAMDQKVIGYQTIQEVVSNLNGKEVHKKRKIFPALSMKMIVLLCFGVMFAWWGYVFYVEEKLELLQWAKTLKEVVENFYQNIMERASKITF